VNSSAFSRLYSLILGRFILKGRLVMDYYDIHNIRELYKNDIKKLREIKMWMK